MAVMLEPLSWKTIAFITARTHSRQTVFQQVRSHCWGGVRGFGTWSVCVTSFVSQGQLLDVLPHLRTGTQVLPVKHTQHGQAFPMRWAMCVAYYVPPGMAFKLLSTVDTATRKCIQVSGCVSGDVHRICLVPPCLRRSRHRELLPFAQAGSWHRLVLQCWDATGRGELRPVLARTRMHHY